jgi:uncharacterized membrane protein
MTQAYDIASEALVGVTEWAILFIDVIALALVLIAVAEALVGGLRLMLGTPGGHQRREVWLRFARWLVAALTFQLAADIIETSITQDWNALVRVGVIAVIRTLLNYFLERDLGEVSEEQRARDAAVRAEAAP